MKLGRITSCEHCEYFHPVKRSDQTMPIVCLCIHPEIKTYKELAGIRIGNHFPDWCPLEDAEN